MHVQNKFLSFLESLETKETQDLITSVREGFILCCFEEGSPIHLKHGDDPDSKFIKNQLTTGTKIEKEEHTDDTSIAKQIAKAHLSEIPTYYTELQKMEDRAKEQ